MQDIDLPLWNEDETDVLPEYRLTYGHVLCQAQVMRDGAEELARYLEIGSIEYAGDLDLDRVPIDVASGCRVLGTEQETHLLIAVVGACYVVFGPHELFFKSTRWIDWNTSVGGLMAYVTQTDVDGYFYRVFGNGKLLVSACTEDGSLRYLEDSPIEVYLGGRRIYHDPGGSPRTTSEIDAFLGSDARITAEDGVINLKMLSSGQHVQGVAHYIFRRADERASSSDTAERKTPEGLVQSIMRRLGM